MSTSLQNIVNVYDRLSLQKDIQGLFQSKAYPRFELKEFYSHQLHQKHEQFRFFVDILEEWNRKLEEEKMPNHINTLFRKNVFIFNTLRSTITQPIGNAHRVLAHLYTWFNSTRNKKIKPIPKKAKQCTEQDEAWEIRNTFKSNLPAEIDMYHRRILCHVKPHQDPLASCPTKTSLQQDRPRKIKTQNNQYSDACMIQNKRIAKIANEVVRFQREQEELAKVEVKWKIKRAREEKEYIKNFERATFSSEKLYFPKKDIQKNRNSTCILSTLKRSKTSAGLRQQKHRQDLTVFTDEKSTVEEIKRKSETIQDPFSQFQSSEKVRLSDIAGMRMIENPFEIKMKKKKRNK